MMSDMETLRLTHAGVLQESTAEDTFRTDRLAGFGLIERAMQRLVTNGGKSYPRYFLSMTAFGRMLCELALGGKD